MMRSAWKLQQVFSFQGAFQKESLGPTLAACRAISGEEVVRCRWAGHSRQAAAGGFQA
jgi:hypothetical protein